jgi:hypothetical protein
MKVLFIKNPSIDPFNLSYGIDEITELNDKLAKEMIEAGFAVELPKEKKPETPESKLPKKEKAVKGVPTNSEGAE